MARPELSLIIPIFNEEAVIPELHRRLREVMAQLETHVRRLGKSSSSMTARKTNPWRY